MVNWWYQDLQDHSMQTKGGPSREGCWPSHFSLKKSSLIPTPFPTNECQAHSSVRNTLYYFVICITMIWHVAWYDRLTMTGLVQGSIFGTSTGRKLPLPASQRKACRAGLRMWSLSTCQRINSRGLEAGPFKEKEQRSNMAKQCQTYLMDTVQPFWLTSQLPS